MILLDTHIWVRWLISNDVGASISELIEKSEKVAVSAISCWEVVYLVKNGRIDIPISLEDWMKAALDKSGVFCLPVDKDIAVLSARLPNHHRDPADRIIIATSITHELPLISFDSEFHKCTQIEELLISDQKN